VLGDSRNAPQVFYFHASPLVESDRIKTQFMGMMSHELRTPMNAILGFSELLLRRFRQYSDFQHITLVERIFENGRHLLAIIEDMLDFSKLKTNRLELQLEQFDLADLAIVITDELSSLAGQKALDLRICLTPSSIPVNNDPARVRQILVNLLSNAIKFTDTGSVLLEIWEIPRERVAIAVSDTGCGIDPVDQAHIFQEFWQVNQSRTRQHSGTGLGLAIVSDG
jgi:signal transduction histidine kinase